MHTYMKNISMNERENALKELINLEKEGQHKIGFYELVQILAYLILI